MTNLAGIEAFTIVLLAIAALVAALCRRLRIPYTVALVLAGLGLSFLPSQTISPDKLFTNFYDKDFLYKLNGEVRLGARAVEEVELTPTDKTKSFFKALLYIDKVQHTLVSIKWFDKGGNRYTLDTSKLNGNAPFTDAQLAYNKSKFPGAEEVDLRN